MYEFKQVKGITELRNFFNKQSLLEDCQGGEPGDSMEIRPPEMKTICNFHDHMMLRHFQNGELICGEGIALWLMKAAD